MRVFVVSLYPADLISSHYPALLIHCASVPLVHLLSCFLALISHLPFLVLCRVVVFVLAWCCAAAMCCSCVALVYAFVVWDVWVEPC